MNSLKKPIDIISKILFALILALALLNVTSCDNMMESEGDVTDIGPGPGQGNTQGNDGQDEMIWQWSLKNHYSEYVNFNPADYPIINESGKSDSEVAWIKDIILHCYAEREDIREWTANYVKTNKIKTILSNEWGSNAWIDPDKLDGLYLNENLFSLGMGLYNDSMYDAKDRANMRESMFTFTTHETMHLVQYKSGAFNLMKGMRPDICAAIDMLTEYLAWFYTERRYRGTIITANMTNAVETQSKYMILSTDPWEYDNARAKDPTLPDYVHSTPWFNNELSFYAQQAFTIGIVRESTMTPPLRQASKEDMLKVARAMLACRDPKMAGVTDEALWTVFDALRKAAVGDSKYLIMNDIGGWVARRDSFENFQALISEWDAEYAKQ